MKSQHYTIDNKLALSKGTKHQKKVVGQASEKENLLLAKYFNIGYYLITPILIGVFFGVGLDRIFHTKPVFTIGLLVLGTVSSFYNLFTLIRDIN